MERKTKVLALVAHDNMKRDLAEWVDWNSRNLSRHHLVCTGTTGKMVEKTLRDHREEDESADGIRELPDLKITLLKSGPLGGDQQLGSLIADGKINALIFFWDPMSAQPPTHIDFMPPNYHTCADFICFAHGNYLFLL